MELKLSERQFLDLGSHANSACYLISWENMVRPCSCASSSAVLLPAQNYHSWEAIVRVCTIYTSTDNAHHPGYSLSGNGMISSHHYHLYNEWTMNQQVIKGAPYNDMMLWVAVCIASSPWCRQSCTWTQPQAHWNEVDQAVTWGPQNTSHSTGNSSCLYQTRSL